MYVVFNGFSKLGAYLSAVGLLTLATYIRIFNAAHRINEALGTRAALTLAGSSFHRFPAETLRELIIFRDILIANPVRISLFGFLPINRNVLGALLVTATTYLVVLVQYSVG
ncbi:gustatory and odorant receptor 24-like [Thrips palmi]|uniref:Gustatory and odorant receptor 24-like n=1 Tax=Thrips palmi TaxID=161013 RepID=A0A6P9A1R1_THRPL|nr:gustatory and odorant receptor 24-like [Thrips palmi]